MRVGSECIASMQLRRYRDFALSIMPCAVVLASALAAALLAPAAAASAEPERKPGPRLFLDDADVADMGGAKIKLHRPTEGAKVIESTEPWENRRIWAYHAMLHNGSHVLLYYYVVSQDPSSAKPDPSKPGEKTQVYTCLATSADGGRSFQKPSLGVIAWNGTKDNNIVWPPCDPPISLYAPPPTPQTSSYAEALELPRSRRYPSGHETGTVREPPQKKKKNTFSPRAADPRLSSAPAGVHRHQAGRPRGREVQDGRDLDPQLWGERCLHHVIARRRAFQGDVHPALLHRLRHRPGEPGPRQPVRLDAGRNPEIPQSVWAQVGFFDERLGKYVAYRRSWIAIPSLQKRESEWCVAAEDGPHCGSCPGAGRNIAR
jgi:hypothetical protein